MYSYRDVTVSGEGDRSGVSIVARSLLWMMLGLLMTLLASLAVLATLPVWMGFYSSRWGPMVLLIAELALVWYLSARLRSGAMAPAEGKALFLLYAASLGIVLVPAVAAAPGAVLPAMAETAGMFGAAGLWGYLTHADMRPLRTALFMGLVGLLIAIVVNSLFLHGALALWISIGGVLLFSGLTAYDIQRIRRMGSTAGDGAAILGALALYLDFINMFLFVLRLGTMRRR